VKIAILLTLSFATGFVWLATRVATFWENAVEIEGTVAEVQAEVVTVRTHEGRVRVPRKAAEMVQRNLATGGKIRVEVTLAELVKLGSIKRP
jgi:RNase P/RNase MRP subunit p29